MQAVIQALLALLGTVAILVNANLLKIVQLDAENAFMIVFGAPDAKLAPY